MEALAHGGGNGNAMNPKNAQKAAVSREINFEYQEFLNQYFKVDKESIKNWIDENFSHYFVKQLDEICIDKD